MKRKRRWQAFAAWILAASIVFGNSSFIVQAEEEVTAEDNAVTEEIATEEITTEGNATKEYAVASEEGKSQEEAEVSTEKTEQPDEIAISDKEKNEIGTMSGEEPTEQPGTENEGGENQKCPFDFEYSYGSRDWSVLFTGEDSPLTLTLVPSEGSSDENISEVKWEVKQWDESGNEIEATCVTWKEGNDGGQPSITLEAEPGKVPEDEELWILVRANVTWGDGDNQSSSSVKTDIQLWEPEYDYYYPMEENVNLLPGWDFGIDKTFGGWIRTADYLEGKDIDVTIMNIEVEIKKGATDAVTCIKRKDNSGWDLKANSNGDAVVKLILDDPAGKITDYPFNVHVSDDVYYMNWYYPQGTNQMVPNSEIEMKIENISMTHEYVDAKGEHQSEPITDFELKVRDDEGNVTDDYDGDIIKVKIDNNSKSVTITSKEEEGDTSFYLCGIHEGQEYCGENISISVVEDYYGLYADKQCAKPGETISVEKFNPVVNSYSYSENKSNVKPVEGATFEFGDQLDESIGVKSADGKTITINKDALSEEDGTRSVRIPIHAFKDDENDVFDLEYWAELVICDHTFTAKWDWSADFKSAILKVTCGKCGVYEASAKAKVISNQITAPTESTVGKMEYTAEAVIEGKTYTDKRTADIPKLEPAQTVVKPAKTKISSVKNVKGRKMTIKWKRNKKATGYQIQYSTDKNFTKGVKKVSIPKNKTVSKTVKKLKKGKYYYVRIRSYKKVSGGKNYSDWSNVKKVKIKK